MYLLILPHQDDEFFIFPYIKNLRTAGHVVKIIYLTNGGYGTHQPATRAKESQAALKKINIELNDIIFFGHQNNIFDAEISSKYPLIIKFLKIFLATNFESIESILIPDFIRS